MEKQVNILTSAQRYITRNIADSDITLSATEFTHTHKIVATIHRNYFDDNGLHGDIIEITIPRGTDPSDIDNIICAAFTDNTTTEETTNTNEEQEDIMETTTTTNKNDNTIEIRCITHRAWEAIQRLMDEAEQAIPEAHCRKRAAVRGGTFMQEIAKRAKTRRIDPRGRDILYSRRTNLGSSRWYAYVVDDYDEVGCEKFTDKSIFDGWDWHPISKCVCVYR